MIAFLEEAVKVNFVLARQFHCPSDIVGVHISAFFHLIAVQVLHHVSDIGQVMKECYRILGPRGALIVNSASPEQAVDTMWFLYLIPEACKKLKMDNRLVPVHKRYIGIIIHNIKLSLMYV